MSDEWKKRTIRIRWRGFLGGPVARTMLLHWQGLGFNPVRELRCHKPCSEAKTKQKNPQQLPPNLLTNPIILAKIKVGCGWSWKMPPHKSYPPPSSWNLRLLPSLIIKGEEGCLWSWWPWEDSLGGPWNVITSVFMRERHREIPQTEEEEEMWPQRQMWMMQPEVKMQATMRGEVEEAQSSLSYSFRECGPTNILISIQRYWFGLLAFRTMSWINFYCFKTSNSQEFVSLVIGTSTLITHQMA